MKRHHQYQLLQKKLTSQGCRGHGGGKRINHQRFFSKDAIMKRNGNSSRVYNSITPITNEIIVRLAQTSSEEQHPYNFHNYINSNVRLGNREISERRSYYTQALHQGQFRIKQTLIPNNKSTYQNLHTTSFLSAVNVGHGIYEDDEGLLKNERDSSSVSPEQRKFALLELKQMISSTSRILSSLQQMEKDSSVSSSSEYQKTLRNDVRVAIHYWLGRWHAFFHPYFDKAESLSLYMNNEDIEDYGIEEESFYPDYGVKQAKRLLDFIQTIQTHPDDKVRQSDFVDTVIGVDGNTIFGDFMEKCLIPCRTTGTDGGMSGVGEFSSTVNQGEEYNRASSKKMKINPTAWKPAILYASQIIDIMNDMHNEPSTTVLKPDLMSYNATFTLWSRVKLLHGYYESLVDEELDWNDLGTDNNDIDTTSPFPLTIDESGQLDLPRTCQIDSMGEVIEKMENLLLQMEKLYFETGDESMRPDDYSYNKIIMALSHSQSKDLLERAEWYLQRMEKTEDDEWKGETQEEKHDDDDTLPKTTAYADAITYNALLNAYSHSPSKAEAILQRMEDRYLLNGRKEIQPDTISYSCVLHGHAVAGNAEESERVLKKIIRLSKDPDWAECVKPNNICFNTAIDAWAKTKGYDGSAVRAQTLLKEMEKLSNTGEYPDLYPDTISYASVISAFARSNTRDGGDRAEELLHHSLDLYNAGNEKLRPDSITFNAVLDALSKQAQKEYYYRGKRRGNHLDENSSESRAEALVDQMCDLHDTTGLNVRPSTYTYNVLIDLYSKTGQVAKAEHAFEEMHQLYEAGDDQMKPCVISYNSFLSALGSSNRREHLARAEDLLRQMKSPESAVKPDIVSYNIILGALGNKKEPGKAKRAEELVLSLENDYLNGESSVQPTNISYNICIDAWSKSGAKDAVDRVEQLLERMITLSKTTTLSNIEPDTISYTSAITTLGRSRKRNASKRAEELFKQMEENNVQPNRITFNSLINCWARSGVKGAAERAEEILVQMTELSKNDPRGMIKPDSVTFSSVINCWARSGEKGAAERAERILNMLEDQMNSGRNSAKPNNYTYSSVIHAWAKSKNSDAAQRALDILNRMERLYESGNESAKPAEPSYNSTMNAFAKSNLENKSEEAMNILRRMHTSYKNGNYDAKPTIRSYSVVLNACAFTRGNRESRQKAFKIAQSCFKEVLSEDYGKPNNIVFGTFLLACSNLVPSSKGRDALMEAVFYDCCKRGLVDTKVILNFRRSLSPDKVIELLGKENLHQGHIEFDFIPEQWRLNVIEERS